MAGAVRDAADPTLVAPGPHPDLDLPGIHHIRLGAATAPGPHASQAGHVGVG